MREGGACGENNCRDKGDPGRPVIVYSQDPGRVSPESEEGSMARDICPPYPISMFSPRARIVFMPMKVSSWSRYGLDRPNPAASAAAMTMRYRIFSQKARPAGTKSKSLYRRLSQDSGGPEIKYQKQEHERGRVL